MMRLNIPNNKNWIIAKKNAIVPSVIAQIEMHIKGSMARAFNSQCNTNSDILLSDFANFQASKARNNIQQANASASSLDDIEVNPPIKNMDVTT